VTDQLDQAQAREEAEREASILRARARAVAVSPALTACLACGDEIEPARRRAVPGVRRCVACQQLAERRGT
jgi:phage/conjugal plasmid C-4 type zinc finger TraR family protein